MHTNIRPEISCFLVQVKDYIQHKYFSHVTFNLQVHSTRSQLHDGWVLIVYQVTIYNKCSEFLHLNQCTDGYVLSWIVVHFQKSRCGCEWFDRHPKYVGEVSFHFQFGLNALGLKFSHRQNRKGLRSTRCWAVPRKLSVCGHAVYWYALLSCFWCGELTHEVCPSIQDTTCIYLL
jgi:hypothetical protein